MSRIVQFTIPSKQVEKVSSDVKKLPELISLQIMHGVSITPKGDVITVQITNRSLPQLMKLLEKHKIGIASTTSIATSGPLSIISPSSNTSIVNDTSESPWEETEQTIAKESNMTVNALFVMAISGFIAAIGILTNTLHIVIAAMVIAPGFEPLSRISLGIITQSAAWKRGIMDTLKAYCSLILGAALGALILHLFGTTPFSTSSSYLSPNALISYWTSITPAALLITITASTAGALLLTTNRSVLTAGVMIALALIPAAALIGIGIIQKNLLLVTQGGLRLFIEMGLVTALSLVIFFWKRMYLHKRKMLPYAPL